MAARTGYRWHLRRLMVGKDMYATTQLGPLLAERGITLSREQVYLLVTGVPERLSLATLAALCGILGCQPGDIIEVVRAPVSGDHVPDQRVAAAGSARPPFAVAGQLMTFRAAGHYLDPGPGITRARTGRGRPAAAGGAGFGLLTAGAPLTSMSSPGWQPRMSHSAARVARLSRSGTPVTSR